MPWSVTATRDRRRPAPADRDTRTSPPSGLNLTALWTRLTTTWPRRASSPRTVGRSGLGLDHERHAVPLREQAEALGGRRGEPAEVDVVLEAELRAALDPGEVQHLVDHLGEVPGLLLDAGDAVAHPRGHVGGLGLAGERLREERDGGQRRPELVAQVVDELGPDLLEAAELGDVLEDHDEVVRGEAVARGRGGRAARRSRRGAPP